MYLERAKALALQLNIAPEEMVPCTKEEIENLEAQINHKLPAAYKEFLLWIGKKGGSLLRGSDAFYYNLPYQQKLAETLLNQNKFPIPLPDDAFIFFSHQGYMFAFFRLSEGNDPPIYHYFEKRTDHFVKSYESFSDFMLQIVKDHISPRLP